MEAPTVDDLTHKLLLADLTARIVVGLLTSPNQTITMGSGSSNYEIVARGRVLAAEIIDQCMK
jgi:hypothetical protein